MKITIPIPMYWAEVIVLIGSYEDMVWKAPEFAREAMGDGEYFGRAVYQFTGSKHVVVIHSISAAMSVIAHEAVHAASMIFNAIGAKADYNNDEHVAYMVQYICHKVEGRFL